MRQKKYLVGLIGEGIQGSRSPSLHEEEGRNLGLSLHYQLIDLARSGHSIADLPVLIDAAEIMGFAGLNITHPGKQAVMPLLGELSGAISNAIANENYFCSSYTNNIIMFLRTDKSTTRYKDRL